LRALNLCRWTARAKARIMEVQEKGETAYQSRRRREMSRTTLCRSVALSQYPVPLLVMEIILGCIEARLGSGVALPALIVQELGQAFSHRTDAESNVSVSAKSKVRSALAQWRCCAYQCYRLGYCRSEGGRRQSSRLGRCRGPTVTPIS
jgi:hypothetical protein